MIKNKNKNKNIRSSGGNVVIFNENFTNILEINKVGYF